MSCRRRSRVRSSGSKADAKRSDHSLWPNRSLAGLGGEHWSCRCKTGGPKTRISAGQYRTTATFLVEVEGTPQKLPPILLDQGYLIAGGAVRNAFRHARARRANDMHRAQGTGFTVPNPSRSPVRPARSWTVLPVPA
jgi:hypothetical protein